MPKDWWKQHQDKQEDLEEARINEVNSRTPPAAAPKKVAPTREGRTTSVDSGSHGTCKHEGF